MIRRLYDQDEAMRKTAPWVVQMLVYMLAIRSIFDMTEQEMRGFSLMFIGLLVLARYSYIVTNRIWFEQDIRSFDATNQD